VIGGARLTNESAYAWAKLAKGIIGTDSVDAQLGDGLPAELVLGLPRATIDQACAAPVLITLAGDLREELPVLFLRLREAVLGATELIEISYGPSALSALAKSSLSIRPGDAPIMAAALCGDAAAATALAGHPEGAAVPENALSTARTLLAAHADGEGVVIVLGRGSYAESGEVVGQAARVLAAALPKATFLPATWAWRRASCPDASGWRPGAAGSVPPGARCRPRPAWIRRGSWPPWPAKAPATRSRRPCCWGPTR
jgi:NADH-quinone oxidoreductase subunit G